MTREQRVPPTLSVIFYNGIQTKEASLMTKNKQLTTSVIDRTTEDPAAERQRQARAQFRRAADAIASRNRDKDPDEEFAFITRVVVEVRQEHDERAQREAKRGR